jgi:hypothetical protein
MQQEKALRPMKCNMSKPYQVGFAQALHKELRQSGIR